MSDTKTLSAALLAAQRALPSVGKDSQFKAGSYGYAYTSSETMIAACREVLHGAGLTLRRAGWKFDGTPEGGGLVTSQFILTHAGTGESVADEVAWVAVPRGQQPIDKAVAGALTASLGYYLRDLLLVPREDENEMDKRDDSAYQPKRATPAPRSNSATPTRTDGGNAPTRQAAQDDPQAALAPKAAPNPAPSKERATAAPSAFGEVMASRPAKGCAWQAGVRVGKVGGGKPTKNGSNRYPILLDDGNAEFWASCFDDNVMQAAKDVSDQKIAVDVFIVTNDYGATLYGIRWAAVESAQAEAATVPPEDSIPF